MSYTIGEIREDVRRLMARIDEIENMAVGGTREFINADGNLAGTIYALDGATRNVLMVGADDAAGGATRLQFYGAGDVSEQNEIHGYNVDLLRLVGAGDISLDAGEILGVNTPGLVRAGVSALGFTTINTSTTTLLSSTITIPAEWTTYDIEAWWMHRIADSSASTGSSNVISTQANFDGVRIGYDSLLEFTNDNPHDNQHISGNGFLNGRTATGVRTIDLTTSRSGAPICNAAGMNLIVHAYRVT